MKFAEVYTVLHKLSCQNYLGECINGDVRLADGLSKYEGRVEICYNEQWGTVCDDDYHESIAYVVCKQLNLPLNGRLNNNDFELSF